MWPSLETSSKTITVAGNFVFITLGTLNRPDLHFEVAGNGPVVITWISREHELYSDASPISLVEHYVTSRHDRRLLSLLGFVHNWPTSRWSATKKKKKKKKRKRVFIKRKWNHIVFSRAIILSFHPVVFISGERGSSELSKKHFETVIFSFSEKIAVNISNLSFYLDHLVINFSLYAVGLQSIIYFHSVLLTNKI